jgi:thioredoxin 1
MSPDNKKEIFAEILNGDTPLLVDFTATWCGSCKMMKPVLEDLHRRKGE